MFTESKDFVGLVLATGEHNRYDDSDFYAIVWDRAARCARKVTTSSTRYAGGFFVDTAHYAAPPKIQEEAQRLFFRPRAYAQLLRAERKSLAVPAKGKWVRVVRGIKVPVGTEGLIFYWDERTYSPRFNNGYKQGPDTIKIGISPSGERGANNRYSDALWTYAKNVEVIDPYGNLDKRALWDRVAATTICPRAFFAYPELVFVQ